MQTRKRPKSLTVIAMFFIISGTMLAISMFPVLLRSERASLSSFLWAILIGAMFGVTHLISGIAILKGLNWGRWLYLCCYPLSVIVAIVKVGADIEEIIIVTVYYIISLIILTRPAVSEYFRKEIVNESETSSC